MKIDRRILTLLIVALLASLPASGRAQDATTSDSDTAASDSNTNTAPTLKDLMDASDQVTNTAGMVLVKISPTLWAGMYEVTQDAYQQVMGSNPSAFPGPDHPVDSVTWNNAMAFCKKLTETEQRAHQLPKGFSYNLLTQAQWEKLVDNASLSDAVMSLNGQRHSSTESVGGLGANSYGLYDMRGNVMEWCLDPQDKPYRVLRGGAWDTFIEINARIDFREYSAPDITKKDYGFRVVLEPKD
jgi:formylglycine-generating enzyme required for sulfatase activity